MNTIKYRDLKKWYLDDAATELARKVFKDEQPRVHQTGFYSAPSWNWGYIIGIAKKGNNLYEVVTAFGQVEGARRVII